jgi:serine/threonine-protein kinase RsbW
LKIPTKINIQVPSDLKALDRILLQFNKIYRPDIAQQDWLQCQLALVEGFTNAVRHAHQNLPSETPIDIQVNLTQEKMTIRIWDRGKDFDLENFVTTMSQQDEQWLGSGRGIAIMVKVADCLEYRRTLDNRNCLLIVKKLHPAT